MDFKRTILYFAVAILGVLLWHAWTLDHPTQNALSAQTTSTASVNSQNTPTVMHPAEFAPARSNHSAVTFQNTQAAVSAAIPKDKMISVKTDLIDAQINLRGGNVVNLKLLKYPISLQQKNTPIQLLNSNNDALYVAQSGLSIPSEKAAPAPIVYASAQSHYVLQNGQKHLIVILTGKTTDGLTIQKTFTFVANNYAISTAIQLTNHGTTNWSGNIYNQITRRDIAVNDSFYSRSYSGASVSTENTPYKKLTFANMAENNFSKDIANGWVAMQQQYFVSAFIPKKGDTLHYYSRSFGNGDDGKNNVFVLGYMSAPINLAPRTTTTFTSTLYAGPEIAKNLQQLARGLDLTVDYGWLWPISKFLFWLMSEIHYYLGNWGWSIILVTILIKIAFYWLSNKSYQSMAKTRDLQPKIKALRDRHGDDKQTMSRAMMELYRTEKINPLGGCLPMVIQIPVFIALYYVLIESVELRQAPFIFWIHDLSLKDPYFILPVLMGLSMLLQQKLSPPPPDPTQAKMMMFLPIIFTVFFATFPAGLVLYWLTNNCASILQQWIVMKTHATGKNASLKHKK